MKKFWVNLLVALLFAALAMTCASAEADEEIILGDGSDLEVQLEAADDGIILEDDLSMDDVELPITEENDGISLDLSPEGLEPATVPADNAVASNDGAEDFQIINGILVDYKGAGGDVVIPDSVTSIGRRAFSWCSSLTSVTIPNSVTSIGEDAFYNCSSLTSVTIPNSVTSIGKYAFYNCSMLTDLEFCADNINFDSFGHSIFTDCPLTNVIISGEVKHIGDRLFCNIGEDIHMTNLTIQEGVESIGEYAFYGNEFESLTIPSSVKVIGDKAFNGCERLKNLTIKEGVETIGDYAFMGCDNLPSIEIPDSITEIGDYAFCHNYATSIQFGCGIKKIGVAAFRNSFSLKSLTIPSSIQQICDLAFSHCTKLESVVIPEGINYINAGAFKDCIQLSNVLLPKSLYEISTRAFANCPKLTDIIIPPNVESISRDTFNISEYTVNKDLVIHGEYGSYAEKYAKYLYIPFHRPCVSDAIDPTCTTEGKTEGLYCSYCMEVIVEQDIIPANGHTEVIDEAVAPTCTKSGLTEGSHCSVCGATIIAQQTVPAKGHKEVVDKAVAPTVKKTGLTEGSHCSVCGKVLVKQKKVAKLISIKKCAITGFKDVVYTGKAIQPAPVVKYNGRKLVKSTDYTVKYANNKAVGTATVTITGIGKYGASVKKTFKINPKAVALAGLTAGKQQLTVKWKKGSGITGYEVQYGLKRSFAGAKKVTIKKAATVKTVLKKLTTGKKYYVRVRAYKTVGGKKYYSAWSKAKGAKVK